MQQEQYVIQLSEQIKKIAGLGEFGPLIKPANGESVPVPELKSALIKAIEIMVRVPLPDSTVEILNSEKSTRIAIRHYLGMHWITTPSFR